MTPPATSCFDLQNKSSLEREGTTERVTICFHINWCLVIQAIGYSPELQSPYLSTTLQNKTIKSLGYQGYLRRKKRKYCKYRFFLTSNLCAELENTLFIIKTFVFVVNILVALIVGLLTGGLIIIDQFKSALFH